MTDGRSRDPRESPDPVASHLPLSPQVYHVLLALGTETLHGYGIIRKFEEMTRGEETLLPGSLYATLGRMAEGGLLEEVPPPPDEASGGPPRRYYETTAFGRSVARAESARLEALLRVARDRDLAPESPR